MRLGFTVVAAVYLAMLLEFDRPEWAGWSVLSVSLSTRADSLEKAAWRVVGTLVGATAALGIVAAFAQDTLAFDVALAVWLGLATFVSSVSQRQDAYGFALIGYSVPIVALADVARPLSAFDTAVDRVSALLLGVGCAYVASALVAPDTRSERARLADGIERVLSKCASWRRGEGPAAPPVDAIFALDASVADAFSTQPSLRTGGRVAAEVAPSLLGVVASGLLEARLAAAAEARAQGAKGPGGFSADVLLDVDRASSERRLREAAVAARMLRGGRRLGRRRVPWRFLASDRDWRGACDDALRTMAAISLLNAFWYVSDWASGSAAITWAAVVCVLFSSRPRPARLAVDFLVGAVVAEIIGVVAHYAILTAPGESALLATAVFFVGALGAAGRADKRAASAGGFGIVVFSALEPANAMRYDLAASLNDAIGTLIGVAVAVLAFAALPPPASDATRRERARGRIARALRSAALLPASMLPRPGRWCAAMLRRAASFAPDGPRAVAEAHSLMLAGLLILALRRADDALGREAGCAVLQEGPERSRLLATMAERCAAPMQRGRLRALSALFAPTPPAAPTGGNSACSR